MDLVQDRVGNMDHLDIHNKYITKDDIVIILLHEMEEDIVEDLREGTNTSNVTHITVNQLVDGVLGHHGESMDLVQHRVGNVDHLAIHNEHITKVDLVIILLHNMVEDVVEDLRFSTNTSNVTHITVIVSTIDLKSQSNTCKTYLSNK